MRHTQSGGRLGPPWPLPGEDAVSPKVPPQQPAPTPLALPVTPVSASRFSARPPQAANLGDKPASSLPEPHLNPSPITSPLPTLSSLVQAEGGLPPFHSLGHT